MPKMVLKFYEVDPQTQGSQVEIFCSTIWDIQLKIHIDISICTKTWQNIDYTLDLDLKRELF